MNPPCVKLGARLHALRRQFFKSQQAFADRRHALGVPITRAMIANWETSRTEIPAQLIPFIAFVLNARVTDLLPDFRKSAAHQLQSLLPTEPKACQASKPKDGNKLVLVARRSPLENVLDQVNQSPRRRAVVVSGYDGRSPFDLLVGQDTRTLLLILIRTLDRNHRQVLLHYYYGGLKIREVAAKLNLSESLVSTRLHRACEKLRQLLHSHGRGHWLLEEFRSQFQAREREW
jgi:RNA polymerase sigma factor (sigma-70 family)